MLNSVPATILTAFCVFQEAARRLQSNSEFDHPELISFFPVESLPVQTIVYYKNSYPG